MKCEKHEITLTNGGVMLSNILVLSISIIVIINSAVLRCA